MSHHSMVNRVFCDYLSVTYNPEQSMAHSVYMYLLGLGGETVFSDNSKRCIRLADGASVIILEKAGWHKVSFGGGAVSFLRDSGEWGGLLSLLAECPHTVTRLDVAIDRAVDAPLVLRDLETRYPSEIKLTRKAVRITRLYSARVSDGALTGTWYAGKRGSSTVLLRVYDKQAEMLTKGVETPPLTRWEFEVSKEYGCTLRDAYEPARLFWHLATPAIFPKRPVDMTDWNSHGEFSSWTGSVTPALPADAAKRLIEHSGVFDDLDALAAAIGANGEDYVIRLVTDRLRAKSAELANAC